MKVLKKTSSLVLFLLVLGIIQANSQKKLRAEEIVAEHLKAVGDQETIAKINNQVAIGNVSFRILRSGGAGADGQVVFASENRKLLVGMNFPVSNYSRELIVFDGKNSKVAFTYDNIRSPFGDYLYRYSEILKEGLFGGVLSTGWSLKRLAETNARVKLEGTKEVQGREAYVLSYLPKGGSDLEVYIFIDKENFRHLRTEYRRIISAGQAVNPDASSTLRERREILVEDFSDYKQVNGLFLPYRYKIYLMLEGQTQGLNEYEWILSFVSFLFNQQLDPSSFDTKKNE
jgi:hypothetical protein